jgi:hypothetical protein
MSLAPGRLLPMFKEEAPCQPKARPTPPSPIPPIAVAVFVITTTLCALGALMLPLAG